MFDGFETFRIPSDRPDPPPKARLSKEQETAILRLVGLNLLLLFVAPIGGATLFAALWVVVF